MSIQFFLNRQAYANEQYLHSIPALRPLLQPLEEPQVFVAPACDALGTPPRGGAQRLDEVGVEGDIARGGGGEAKFAKRLPSVACLISSYNHSACSSRSGQVSYASKR